MVAIRSYPRAMLYVPRSIRDSEGFYMAAITNNGAALRFFPESQKTPEVCMVAVQNDPDGNALDFVPRFLQTPEICMMAVKTNGEAVRYVPNELRTPELHNIAANHDLFTYDSFLKKVKSNGYVRDIPLQFCTMEMYSEAVKCRPSQLRYVPDAMKTPDMCMRAVRGEGEMLFSVPNSMRTPDMCLLAVKRYPEALFGVPDALKTQRMCTIACMGTYTGYFDPPLSCVPVNLRTAEMCMHAVRATGKSLEYVPEELKTKMMCLLAAETLRSIEYVPDRFKTVEMCMKAIEYDTSEFDLVPPHLLTEEVYMAAAKMDLMYPDRFIQSAIESGHMTPELIGTLIREHDSSYEDALDWIPAPNRTVEICRAAVKADGYSLCYVPEPLKDKQMCMEAVKSWGGAIVFVPVPMRRQHENEIYMACIDHSPEMIQRFPALLAETEDEYGVRMKKKFLDPLVPHGVDPPINDITSVLPSIYTDAVKRNAEVLSHIPERLRGPAMCVAAVRKDCGAMCHVPVDLLQRLISCALCKQACTFHHDDQIHTKGLAFELALGLNIVNEIFPM